MLKINDQLRMQDVYRWDTIPVARRQSVAEHTFNVVAIARAIAMKMRKSHHPSEFIRDVMCHAYDHDFEEAITGDIISPTKRRIEKAGFDVNRELKLEFITAPSGYSSNVYEVVKIADEMEAVWFISENGRGRCGRDRARVMLGILIKKFDKLGSDVKKAAMDTYDDMVHEEFMV